MALARLMPLLQLGILKSLQLRQEARLGPPE